MKSLLHLFILYLYIKTTSSSFLFYSNNFERAIFRSGFRHFRVVDQCGEAITIEIMKEKEQGMIYKENIYFLVILKCVKFSLRCDTSSQFSTVRPYRAGLFPKVIQRSPLPLKIYFC